MSKEKVKLPALIGKRVDGKVDEIQPDIAPDIAENRHGMRRAVGRVVETINTDEEIKGMLCELYDKVNIAVTLCQGRKERGFEKGSRETSFFRIERFKMLKRYLLELHQLGAPQKDYAKFIALWNGDIEAKHLAEYEAAARDCKVALDLDIDLEPIMKGMDPLKVFSAPEDFQNATEARYGLYGKNQQRIEFGLRLGCPMTLALYSKLQNYVAWDPEHKVHSRRLVLRSAQELAELSDMYKDCEEDGSTTLDLFEKVAAILLHMYKSSFVNVFNDEYVLKTCRKVLKGTTKNQFFIELIGLGRIPSIK